MRSFTNLISAALIIFVLSGATLKAGEMISIAILEFENRSGDMKLEHLKCGISGMITTDITRIQDITVVERAKLNMILQEINFNRSKYVDQSTAVKIGKLLSASYLLTGAYYTDQNKIRIDVRLINTERGVVVYTEIVEGKTDDFFKLEHQLITAILKNMKPSITEKELEYLRKQKELAMSPAEMFSNALLVSYDIGYTEAVKWVSKAAEQGFAPAQGYLGWCYYHDCYGVRKDLLEAVRWFRKAAEQGDINAQTMLGFCYHKGQGIKQNYVEAAKWYRKAAEQGDGSAQSYLAAFYYHGLGVNQDCTEAVKWSRKAAEQGMATSQYLLGIHYYTGDGVKQDYTEAVKWFRKAAEQGDSDAQYQLGICYYNGVGVSRDYDKAVKWYRKAAELGNANAQYELAKCYTYGHGVQLDSAQATKYFHKAAESGHANAQFVLGTCYYHGSGVKKDQVEAIKWFRKAADQGDEDAISELKRIKQQ